MNQKTKLISSIIFNIILLIAFFYFYSSVTKAPLEAKPENQSKTTFDVSKLSDKISSDPNTTINTEDLVTTSPQHESETSLTSNNSPLVPQDKIAMNYSYERMLEIEK